MMKEILEQVTEMMKPVKRFKGIYEISESGIIKSVDRIIKVKRKGETHNRIQAGRVLLQKEDKDGYLGVCLFKNKKRHYLKIHRLVAKNFIKNPKKKSQVNHKDGDKKNNCVLNLEWSTPSENTQHAYDNMLIVVAKGEKCHFSKLTGSKVIKIRNLHKAKKLNQKQLAEKFKVSKNCISLIIKRITWKHI